MRVIKPIVASTSPALYQAATRANMPPEQQSQIEQMSWAVQKNKELNKLEEQAARTEFETLTPNAQESLRFFYQDADYSIKPPTLAGRAIGALKWVGGIIATPIVKVFQAAGEYNKLINTPYAVARQVAQGESIFDYHVWDDAWDGRDLFDSKAIDEVTNTFGKAKTFIAKGLLEGKTPGEIVEAYGKITPDLVTAMEEAFNNPDGFKEVLDATKFAQISPGRDIIRFLLPMPPKNGSLAARDFTSRGKLSGTIDFIYQIAIDPLTWITGGTTKLLTRGTKLAEMVTKQGDYTVGISQVFKEADVAQLWNKELGPALKKLDDVKGDTTAYVAQLRFIKRKYKGYNNDEILDFFVKNKMFDADTAENVFQQGDNVFKLLSGRVDGMSYARNGVVTSRNTRRVGQGLQNVLENAFDKVYVAGDKVLSKNPLSTLKGKDLSRELKIAGSKADSMVNPNLPEFLAENADITKFKRSLLEFSRQASRNPSGQAIITGKDSVKTLNTFRNYARLILDRDMAEYVTREFQLAAESEQIVIIRNVYASILQRAGITDKAIIAKHLDKTLGGRAGFSNTTRTPIDIALERIIDPALITRDGDNLLLEASGAIQLSQIAGAVGPLPLEAIRIEANQILSKESLIIAAKGSLRSKWAKDYVDAWSTFTLYARLGVRSAIDEGFMYLMTAPGRDLLNFARGQGRKLGQRSAIYTGSKGAEGPITEIIRKYITKQGLRSQSISIAERNNIISEIAKKQHITESEVQAALINETVAARAQQLRNTNSSLWKTKPSVGAIEDKYWKQAMIHHSDMLESMASSVTARSSLGGGLDAVIRNNLISISSLDKTMREITETMVRAQAKASGKKVSEKTIQKRIERKLIIADNKWGAYAISELNRVNPKYVTLGHFDNFGITFSSNRQHGKNLLLDEDNSQFFIAPAKAFFRNKALRTPEDFVRAQEEMYTSLGMVNNNGVWNATAESQKSITTFVDLFSETVASRAKGLTDVEIAKLQVQKMLIGLKDTFHGGPKEFNQDLYNLVLRNYQDLVDKQDLIRKGLLTTDGLTLSEFRRLPGNAEKKIFPKPDYSIRNKWQTAINRIEFEEFDKATLLHQPVGDLRTRIRFPEFGDFETAYKRLGDEMMGQMDRQVTGLLRQPALMVAYIRIRSEYSKIEATLNNRLFQEHYTDELRKTEEWWQKTLRRPPTEDALYKMEMRLHKRVDEQIEKLFTERAIAEAADGVLKYADNPAIRTNLAVSARTVGRFYRASEDFWRRVYRLGEVSPTVLYRMRLTHLGLEASGIMHKDQNGELYFMMPMDNILFKATDTTLKVLTGNSQYKQPLFDNFTMKVSNVNPSFAPDSGLPMLSGPIAGLAVKAITNLLGKVPIPGAELLSQDFDRYALGSMGDDAKLEAIVVPGSLLKLWKILPIHEKSRQEVTAAQQAIAYNAANGYSLKPTIDEVTGEVIPVSDEEKYEYLKGIRISAHNIIALRSILGLISPISPGLQESVGLPDYLLDVGVTGLRSEFWDIYEAIQKKYGDDVRDPYELALSMFTGSHPGKIVYTVSRDEKQTKVLLAKTTQMRNWSIKNKKLIQTYGEAAYIFAPHTGDFNATIYNWLHASDLVKDKDMATYYDDVAVAEDKQKYYNIAKWEKEQLSKEGFVSERKSIIEGATAARQGMLMANPLLLQAITGGGNEIGKELIMLNSLKEIIANPDAPIQEGLRMKMQTAVKAVQDFMAFAQDERTNSMANASNLKAEYRQRVEAVLKDLSLEDPSMKEALRAIFNSILSYHSRNTYKAGV